MTLQNYFDMALQGNLEFLMDNKMLGKTRCSVDKKINVSAFEIDYNEDFFGDNGVISQKK
ncbi:MAG: hypothetical protein V3U92_03800 [Cellulophaga sp.]